MGRGGHTRGAKTSAGWYIGRAVRDMAVSSASCGTHAMRATTARGLLTMQARPRGERSTLLLLPAGAARDQSTRTPNATDGAKSTMHSRALESCRMAHGLAMGSTIGAYSIRQSSHATIFFSVQPARATAKILTALMARTGIFVSEQTCRITHRLSWRFASFPAFVPTAN